MTTTVLRSTTRINDNLMVYGSFATGYKGGGINPRPFFAVQIATFGEEEVETTEIGVKATSRTAESGSTARSSRTIRLASSSTKRSARYRSGRAATVIIGPPCAKPANVGDADADGVELEMEIAATDRLSFDFMASSLDQQYTRLDPSVAHSSVVPGGRGQMTLDMKTPFTPETTWSAGIQYEFPLGGGGSLTTRVDASFQDEVYTQAVNYAQAQPLNDRKTAFISDYTLAHARVTWRSASGDWETALDVSNLTDELYYQNIVDGVYTTIGYQAGVVGPPRMWTMAFRKSFGL